MIIDDLYTYDVIWYLVIYFVCLAMGESENTLSTQQQELNKISWHLGTMCIFITPFYSIIAFVRG